MVYYNWIVMEALHPLEVRTGACDFFVLYLLLLLDLFLTLGNLRGWVAKLSLRDHMDHPYYRSVLMETFKPL